MKENLKALIGQEIKNIEYVSEDLIKLEFKNGIVTNIQASAYMAGSYIEVDIKEVEKTKKHLTPHGVFIKCGCREDSEYKGLFSHKDYPFQFVERDGFLIVLHEYSVKVNKKPIPFTYDNLKRIIKSFNP